MFFLSLGFRMFQLDDNIKEGPSIWKLALNDDDYLLRQKSLESVETQSCVHMLPSWETSPQVNIGGPVMWRDVLRQAAPKISVFLLLLVVSHHS